MITRRDALLALPATCAALAALAQAPKSGQPKRIGGLNWGAGPDKSDSSKPIEGEGQFWDAMSKKGWGLGENVLIERAYASWKAERLAGLAEELVRRRVDVIMTDGEESAVAAARATRTLPILFAGMVWPLEHGLIDSYAKPGRNATGFSIQSGTDVITKRLELLRAIVPSAKRLSWIWGGPNISIDTVAGGRIDAIPLLEPAAHALGFDTRFHIVRAPEDIADVFGEVTAWGAQAISAGGRPVYAARQHLAGLALRHGLPIASNSRGYLEAGALLSYGIPVSEYESINDRLVEYLDRILRGTKPADLPVIEPNRYELVINMKTAKALGLTIPQSLLLRADELIQ